MDWLGYESTAYTVALVASFLLIAVWEGWYPLRDLRTPTGARWAQHGLLFAAGAAFQALAVRSSPLMLAWSVRDAGWGLLNRPYPPWAVRVFLTLLALDLVRYLTHRLFHSFLWLWRIHEVHHSDTDYDVSTGVRFHPFEVAGAKAIYLAAVGLLAPPLEAVLLAEVHTVLLNAFSHANIALPDRWERALRRVIVTPGLHRIHHSTEFSDQNHNFGQTFVWWDRLFGTYREEALAGGEEFPTGVQGVTGNGALALLGAPFQKRPK